MVSTIVLASDNSAGSTTVTVTTPTDLFTATTQLWGGFNSGPKFDGEEYQSKSASEKMSQLWGSITADTKSSTYSTAKTAAIFLEDLSETFTWVSDTLPRSHKKSIHSVGNVAKMSWKSTGNHPYTGVFKGWTDVLVRMSSAVAPTDTSVAPGMGVKFLRDGEASSNFVAMFSVDGQSELNFFAKTWVNHIPAATTEAPKLLSKKFATKQGV